MADLEGAFRRALETVREDARQHVNSGVREPENLDVTSVTGITGQGRGYPGYTLPRVGCNRETTNKINAVTPVTPVTPRKTAHLKNENLVFTLCPRIVREPPFGSDGVPSRYLTAWHDLLAQCPPGVKPLIWEATIYDAASLFGMWGEELVRLGWVRGDLFDVPREGKTGGLAWAIKGGFVVTLGPERVFLQDGRIFDRKLMTLAEPDGEDEASP
jgi:hypothetical protein